MISKEYTGMSNLPCLVYPEAGIGFVHYEIENDNNNNWTKKSVNIKNE